MVNIFTPLKSLGFVYKIQLNIYPVSIIATAITAKNVTSNGILSTRFKITASGRLKPMTDIMKASAVPTRCAFFDQRADDGDNSRRVGIQRDADQHRRRHRPPGLFAQDGSQRIFGHVPVNPCADGNANHNIQPDLADDLLHRFPGAFDAVGQVSFSSSIPLCVGSSRRNLPRIFPF